MFIYFLVNKPSSVYRNKGQVAAIFIAVIVILIIMAMVTINIGKVAFIKTESSNAVDSGALAGGSAMANVFNSVAVQSAKMNADYWGFYTSTASQFAIATAYLISANTEAVTAEASALAGEAYASIAYTMTLEGMMMACASPCAAIGFVAYAISQISSATSSMASAVADIGLAIKDMGSFISVSKAIDVSVAAFYLAQNFLYMKIYEAAQTGRENAVKASFGTAFGNSGIGSKLPRDTRDNFQDFMEAIADNPEYTYSWTDGEGRPHSVRVQVDIAPVNSMDLIVSMAPFPVIAALLAGILITADLATTDLSAALTSYTTAGSTFGGAIIPLAAALAALSTACGCTMCDPECTACVLAACAAAMVSLGIASGSITSGLGATGAGLATNGTAIGFMIALYPMIAATLAALLPEGTYTDNSGDAWLYIPGWIDDINHDRLVTVRTEQAHAGKDLGGLWEAKYPGVTSFSRVNFAGNGDIGDFVRNFDASIIVTDELQ